MLLLTDWLQPSVWIHVTLEQSQTQYCFDYAFSYQQKPPPPFRKK